MSVYNRSSRYERILRKKKKILRRRRRLSAAVMASAAMLAGMFFFIQSSISGEKGNIGGEKNADAALIACLSGYLEQMKQNRKDEDLFVAADVAFHQCICEGTGNPLLAKIMVRVLQETERNQHSVYSMEDLKRPIYYHTMILDAIKQHDAQRAREYMHQHLQAALELLQSRLEEEKRTSI